ncbi:MAG: hypothetical protein GF313_00110, partial [Caldithrix sp.]|nr:hypothetical protein [Caldithrix sp.]
MKALVSAIIFYIFFIVPAGASITLPDDRFAGDWQKSGTPLTFDRENLYGRINGGAEIFLEYGFEQLLVQKYMNAQKRLELEIYRM